MSAVNSHPPQVHTSAPSAQTQAAPLKLDQRVGPQNAADFKAMSLQEKISYLETRQTELISNWSAKLLKGEDISNLESQINRLGEAILKLKEQKAEVIAAPSTPPPSTPMSKE